MSMIWFDVKKEPLPTHVRQVLVKSNLGKFAVADKLGGDCYLIYHYYTVDLNGVESGDEDFHVIYWAYIDPTGIEE